MQDDNKLSSIEKLNISSDNIQQDNIFKAKPNFPAEQEPKIIVRNISRNVHVDHLIEMFETYTQIKTIEVPIKMLRTPVFESMMHQESYSNNFYEQKKIKISNFMQQDYAEVEFQNLQDAEQAFMRFNGAQLDGQVLKLKFYPIRIDRVMLEEEFKQKYNITEEQLKQQELLKEQNHKEIARESRIKKTDSRQRSRSRGRDRKRSHSRDYKHRSPARNGRYRRNSPARRPQRGKYQSYRGGTRRDRSYSRNRDRRGRYNNHRGGRRRSSSRSSSSSSRSRSSSRSSSRSYSSSSSYSKRSSHSKSYSSSSSRSRSASKHSRKRELRPSSQESKSRQKSKSKE
eukprot:403366165